jgi:RNA polymerase sigma-70 factor (ECF subfamily)
MAVSTEQELLQAARTGDENAFQPLVEPYRGELHAHCYRMLGSVHDAEDALQEAMLRAWRGLPRFEGRSSLRSWLYTIATNTCLNQLAKRPKRVLPVDYGPSWDPHDGVGEPVVESVWIEPYPDSQLGDAVASPEARYEQRESVELAFVAALQHLPANQRAALILREVLGFSAQETAESLDTTVASVNSALQRARATLKKHLPERRLEWAPGVDPSEAERALLKRYIDANDRADADAFVAMMREDARFAMPPEPEYFVGREAIVAGWMEGGLGTEEFRDFRWLVTRANMQPAVAFYLRRPGESEHAAFAMDVLRIEDGVVAEVTTFEPRLFPAFGLPMTL